MPAHVIVWNLETVPDLQGFAAANDLDGKSDDEIREAMGDKFPNQERKQKLHRSEVACIADSFRIYITVGFNAPY